MPVEMLHTIRTTQRDPLYEITPVLTEGPFESFLPRIYVAPRRKRESSLGCHIIGPQRELRLSYHTEGEPQLENRILSREWSPG